MTNEELLQPRYIVTNKYPFCQWELGMILTVEPSGELYCKENGYIQSKYIVLEKDVEKYPKDFRKLEWWEKRTEVEMPEYVKYVYEGVEKVAGWDFERGLAIFEYYNSRPIPKRVAHLTIILPATIEEYESHQKINYTQQ